MAGDDQDLRYFQALEEAFIRLRGAPLLLSPHDWQVARRWRELGIPLEVAIAGMTELFARRRERGNEERVSSLRYCARAVEGAWKRLEELQGPSRRRPAPALDLRRRLERLAASLPAELPDRAALSSRLLALEGDAATVESELMALDESMLDAAASRLDDEARRRLDGWVDRRLQPLRSRLDDDGLARAAARLRAGELRRRAGLPLLSLFSPDAGEDEPPPASG